MKIETGNSYVCVKEIYCGDNIITVGSIFYGNDNALLGYTASHKFVSVSEKYCTEEYFALNSKSNYNSHYDRLREKAAIAAMQSLIDNNKASHDLDAIVVAQNAIRYADELIAMLKKGE